MNARRFSSMAAGALLIWLAMPSPAQAAVTITFWSHESDKDFPHAFLTLRGVPDAGGSPVDLNYGFTARALTPALLFRTVHGRVEVAMRRYIEDSDAQFSVVMTDAQYADILALVSAWDEKTGDSRYNLNRRNCVSFVREAARRVGLGGLDHPELMKRPRSYLQAVEAANQGQVVHVGRHGSDYLAALPELPGAELLTAPLRSEAQAELPASASGQRD